MEDNTQDILDRYDKRGTESDNEDDLSLYSEGSIFKENVSPVRLSPFKTSPIKSSTNKVSTSPMKNPLFTPRNPRSSKKPINSQMTSAGMTNGSSPLRSKLNKTSSDISMDRNIHGFINKTLQELGPELDNDKTDLLIRETHNVINEVPSSILNSKEGEEYQQMISTSLHKLIRKCESLSAENEKLKSNNHETIIEQLQSRINGLIKSNELHKQDLLQQNDDFLKLLNENNGLKHENGLLRAKLMKYKNLYESKLQLPTGFDKVKTRKTNPKVNSKQKHQKLVLLYNEMADILNKEKKTSKYWGQEEELDLEPELSEEDENDEDFPNAARLLKQFEKILPRRVSPRQDHDELYEKIKGLMEGVMQSNETKGKDVKDIKSKDIKPKDKQDKDKEISDTNEKASTSSNQDIVLKCYLCCKDIHNQPVEQAKRKCERCSTASSGKAQEAELNHALELMGEYKWTL